METKPHNKSVKDWLIEQTTKELSLPEELVEHVISWSYKNAKEATYTNSSVELSGFGKLLASPSKIRRRIVAYERRLKNKREEFQTEKTEEQIKVMESTLQYLYSKNQSNEIKLA